MLKNIIISAITAIVVLVLFMPSSNNSSLLGGFTNYDELELNGAGTGTTTLKMTGTLPSCIQMRTTNGSTTRAYLQGTTTVLKLEEGSCE